MLGSILGRVRQQGDSFVIEHDGEAVAALEPVVGTATWASFGKKLRNVPAQTRHWGMTSRSSSGTNQRYRPTGGPVDRYQRLHRTGAAKLDLEVLVRLVLDEPIALAAVTVSELLASVSYANRVERRERRQAIMKRILAQVPSLSFALSAARVYAQLVVDLRKAGQTVGAHELQIAATALARSFEMTTSDGRDFGLVVRRTDTLG